MKLIPLRARDGSVRAHAIVDDADYAALTARHWYMCSAGYAARSSTIAGRLRQVLMHRQLLGLAHGDPRQGDHVNRNPLDNQRSNLRIVSDAENKQNRRARSDSATGIRGVSPSPTPGKWIAGVTVNGKHHHLGTFVDRGQAVVAVRDFRRQHTPLAPEALTHEAPDTNSAESRRRGLATEGV